MMRIALVDPFYDISHQLWSVGLQTHSSHDIDIYALKPVHWKWKMASGALTLAQQINDSAAEYDLFLVTDMLDLGLFKSSLSSIHRDKPIVLYFHENQITYPWSEDDPDMALDRDHHYGWLNFTSAILSDRVYFNSAYHKTSFLDALPGFLKRFPSTGLFNKIGQIAAKSKVISIGLDLPQIESKKTSEQLTIIWNHRWESDKNPELFYKALLYLQQNNVPFNLIVCGKEYEKRPKAFDKIQQSFSTELIHWGYAESRQEYLDLLSAADVSIVTSNQDFFGISVVESIYAGCTPLLPNRLSYPDHIPPEYHSQLLYNTEAHLYEHLDEIVARPIDTSALVAHIKKYDWSNLIADYDVEFQDMIGVR
jgi:glycosyltransferase involved in cell wall biosynthesis